MRIYKLILFIFGLYSCGVSAFAQPDPNQKGSIGSLVWKRYLEQIVNDYQAQDPSSLATIKDLLNVDLAELDRDREKLNTLLAALKALGTTPLHLAITNGNLDDLKSLINLDRQYFRSSILALGEELPDRLVTAACMKDNIDMVKTLMDTGNVVIRKIHKDQKNHPVAAAIDNKNYEMIDLLFRNMHTLSIFDNIIIPVEIDGHVYFHTPLAYAVRTNNLGMVQFISSFGEATYGLFIKLVGISNENKNLVLPLDIAEENGYEEIKKFLLLSNFSKKSRMVPSISISDLSLSDQAQLLEFELTTLEIKKDRCQKKLTKLNKLNDIRSRLKSNHGDDYEDHKSYFEKVEFLEEEMKSLSEEETEIQAKLSEIRQRSQLFTTASSSSSSNSTVSTDSAKLSLNDIRLILEDREDEQLDNREPSDIFRTFINTVRAQTTTLTSYFH